MKKKAIGIGATLFGVVCIGAAAYFGYKRIKSSDVVEIELVQNVQEDQA